MRWGRNKMFGQNIYLLYIYALKLSILFCMKYFSKISPALVDSAIGDIFVSSCIALDIAFYTFCDFILQLQLKVRKNIVGILSR